MYFFTGPNSFSPQGFFLILMMLSIARQGPRTLEGWSDCTPQFALSAVHGIDRLNVRMLVQLKYAERQGMTNPKTGRRYA